MHTLPDGAARRGPSQHPEAWRHRSLKPQDAPHQVQVGRLPWQPVSRRGLALVRRHRLLRQIGLWMLEHSPGLRAMLLHQFQPFSATGYRQWAALHDTLDEQDRAAIADAVARLPPTRISVVTSVEGVGPAQVRATLASLQDQLHPHWQVCLAATAPDAAMAAALAEAADERRARVVLCGAAGPAAALNAAGVLADGELVALLAPGGLLRPHALYEIAAAFAARPTLQLAYADEDMLDERGQRHTPVFKTAWSPDLLLGHNMLGRFAVFRAGLLRALGGLRESFGPAAMHDLALRASAALPASRIGHIPAVLTHHMGELAPPGEAGRRAVQAHLDRTAPHGGQAVPNPLLPGYVRPVFALPEPAPLASLIVPTRDHADLLAACADALLNRTDYPALELVVVDNGSVEPDARDLLARLAADPRVRVLEHPGPFNFSALTNRGAEAARGEILVLVNNDITVITPGWLSEMVALACRPDVGAVGAKLLYSDGRLQHGGVALGVGGVAAHLELFADRADTGYCGRLAMVRDVSAVTGACLAIRRDLYRAIGGMNERDLAVAYNDIDLCLRLRERGLRVVWTPFAELHHLESASRSWDLKPAELPRFQREIAYMQARWGDVLANDPFYGPNFSLRDGHYRLSAPRRRKPWAARRSVPPSVRPAGQAAWTSPGLPPEDRPARGAAPVLPSGDAPLSNSR